MNRRIALPFPEAVRELVSALRNEGARPFLVGGAVRDLLLGKTVEDLDLEVFGIGGDRLEEHLSRFGRVEAVGRAFSVFKVGGVAGLSGELDVSIPRRDSKSGAGHRGFEVVGDPGMEPSEAVRRRDFTINAILADAATGDIVDPVGGVADLEAGVLRVVDPERFGDDPLRTLRGAQLAARLSLRVDPAASEICRAIPLGDLPGDRVRGEMEKLLLLASRPSIGFELLREWNRLGEVVPELLPTIGCLQDPAWHPEGDVWIHTMLSLDRIPEVVGPGEWGELDRPRALSVALAVLGHDFGKPSTTRLVDGRWRSLGHCEAGVEPTRRLLDRWNVHSMEGFDVRGQVLALVAQHLQPGLLHDAPKVGPGAFRRLARGCEPDLLARVSAADLLGRGGTVDATASRWFRDRSRELGVERRPPPPILLGRNLEPLGVAPGPEMGRLLARLYGLQLDGEFADLDGGIEAARRMLGLPDPLRTPKTTPKPR